MKKIFYFLLFSLAVTSCREAYNPPIVSPETGYLVVDGFINSGGGTSTIILSRTTKLVDTVSVAYEHNAQVFIESDNNEVYSLTEGVNGEYTSDILNLNPTAKYHIRIKTSDGKEYISDFASVKTTPVIDSISWKRENDGVQTYINAHDNLSTTKYYRWSYIETWQIRSSYATVLKYQLDEKGLPEKVVYRFPSGNADTTIYNCWKSYTARNIILGTTAKLSSDIIYLPLTYIPPASRELSVLYSVELKQYALSQGAYNFFDQMRKNTEQLGSIFDAQPSELIGNIHCTTNPVEVVIGYVDVTQEQTKRIFISHKDAEPWYYNAGCGDLLIPNNQDSILKYGSQMIPTYPNTTMRGEIIDFYAAYPECVDCTLSGSNVRPSFWP